MDWAAVFGRVVTVTGWTWQYVEDEVDLKMLNELYHYWNNVNPPTHEVTYALFQGLPGSSKSAKPTKPLPAKASDPRISKTTAAASELISAGYAGVKTKAPDWYKPNG